MFNAIVLFIVAIHLKVKQLAQKGYVGMALDMYGTNKRLEGPDVKNYMKPI